MSSAAVAQAGWVTGLFVILMVVRLGANILLAHLLAPAIFGVMSLINSLRTGIELLTDVGIGQNIIVNKKGDQPDFFNTAWTIQALRGLLLSGLGALCAWPLAWFYGQPSLFPILLLCSTIFFLTGMHTPALMLMQRRLEVRRLTLIDAGFQVTGLLVSIGFAFVMPTVWGMTWVLVVHCAICTLISYALMDLSQLKFRLQPAHVREILHFGKWIFLSSLVFFVSSNFDRLYLPLKIPLALFGVYGISKSMSDLAVQLMQRIGANVVFPAIARESESLQDRISRVVKLRSAGLALIGVTLGGGIAVSDLFVTTVYDHRYAAATLILPMLLAGAWFSIQAAISEQVLMGLGKPGQTATANLLKLGVMVPAIMLAFHFHSMLAALLVLSFADLPRYAVLLAAQHRSGLRFGLHDVALFAVMILAALAFRAPMVGLGLADGVLGSQQVAEAQILLASMGE